jgi:hypothetical protein
MSEEEKARLRGPEGVGPGVHPFQREQRPNADDKEAARAFVRNIVKGYFPGAEGRRDYGGEYINIS